MRFLPPTLFNFVLRNTGIRWPITLGLMALLYLVDFAVPTFINSHDQAFDFVSAAVFGIFAAHATAIALWAVYAPLHCVVRLPAALFLSMLMWYALIAGETHKGTGCWNDNHTLDWASSISICIWSMITVLWISKIYFRVYVVPPGDAIDQLQQRLRQFHIRDLLFSMLLLAVILSPLQFFTRSNLDRAHIHADFVAGLSIVLMFSMLVAVCYCWCGWCPEYWYVLLPLGATGATFLSFFDFIIWHFGIASEAANQLIASFITNIVLSVSVLVLAILYRKLGYTLQRVPSKCAVAASRTVETA